MKMKSTLRFYEHMRPIPRAAVFRQDGYHVWCGSMVKRDGEYFLFYSRWPRETGFGGWVTDCEVAVARGTSLFGEFTFDRVVLKGEHDGSWDGSCVHNPTVLEYGGKYYMYHMGNDGEGDRKTDWWAYRNRQRVGCAEADHPLGPWRHSPAPVVDISPAGHDSLMTSNPAATVMPDGKVLLVYKTVARDDSNMPKGGAVVCGAATADGPLGPFIKSPKPIMQNPVNPWSVEDPFIWRDGVRYYAIVKDFHGYFTRSRRVTLALFVSEDGFDWRPADEPYACERVLHWEDGVAEPVANFERPQIYFEDGRPRALICAVSRDSMHSDTFNVRVPLDF